MATETTESRLKVANHRAEDTVRSLRDTAASSLAIEQGAERLAAATAARATTGEELRKTFESMAARIEETGTSAISLARSQSGVVESTRGIEKGAEATSTGLEQMAASIAAVRKDAELLSGSVDTTAATLEETARSIKSVSTNAE